MPGVIGMDLAPRHSGFCYIPEDWRGGMDDLEVDHSEYDLKGKMDPEAKVKAMLAAANVVINMVERFGVKYVAVEGYAIGSRDRSVTDLAELCGIIKSQLWLAHNIVVKTVVVSSARKRLMGSIRGKRKTDKQRGIRALKGKRQVEVFLKNRGMDFGNEDVMDSFAVGYYYWYDLNDGVYTFSPAEEFEQVVPIGVDSAARRQPMDRARKGSP